MPSAPTKSNFLSATTMRVGIIALLHESNTFVTEATTLDKFEQVLLLTGDAVRDRLAGAKHEVGGFFQGLAEAGIDAAPLFAARAYPFGVIRADAYDRLIAII